MRLTWMTLILVGTALIWAQTTAGPVTQIVTGGTVKVATGTPVVSGGTSIVSGGTTVIGGGGAPVWTQVQAKWGTITASGGTTLSVTLTSAPTAGNLMVCNILAVPNTHSQISIQDNASTPNVYTLSPSSPSTISPSSAWASLAYLVAPSGAGATITVTLAVAVTASAVTGCEEFHKSAGTPTFDKDIAGNGTPGGNIANTPSITPSAPGELLVGTAYLGGSGALAAGSPWALWPPGLLATNGQTTNCGTGNTCAFGDEVILSSSGGATALNFTLFNASIYWNSLIAAFK